VSHRNATFIVLFLLPFSLFSASASGQGDSSTQTKQQPAQDQKQKKKSERKLMKELDTPYRKWLDEDVLYIITGEEKTAFLQLATNEEREQFIEQFWLRRSPTPDSPENTFREEHYRRIAYANEHFASGMAGWRTDRGRIYIIWGKPDDIDAHPSGGSYERPQNQGGGNTSTFPFEDWHYRYLEGVGDDITLEFIDPTMSGEYRLTKDPCEKDALAHVGNAGPTALEAQGMSTKADRFTQTDGTTCGKTLTSGSPKDNAFSRMEIYAKVQQAPPVKFKDLETLVTSRVLRNQINLEYRFDFIRVTSDTVLVPITVQIPNRQVTFENKNGVHSAVLNLFGRVSTLTGRIVQTFEDTINRDVPDSLLRQTLKSDSIYQKTVPLRPGLYRLDLVLKDVNSGNVGTINTRLAVPRYDEDKLSASTLILADQIERVPAQQIGLGQFVIGDSKVRPRLDPSFSQDERLGVYLQLYNIGVDEKTHRSDVSIHCRLTRVPGGQEILRQDETGAQLGQLGQQVTLEKLIAMSAFEPGRYKIEIQVTDNIAKQTISPAAEFTVKPAKTATAARN
jgi:GWxTD domain-containing protein